MKEYPLEIMPLSEAEADGWTSSWRYGWYSKGHHDSDKFAEKLLTQEDVALTDEEQADIQQGYWRCLPFMPGYGPGGRFIDAEGGGHGAFPVTYVEEA